MPTTNPVAGQKAVVQLGPTTYTTVTGVKTAEIQISNDIYDVTDLNSNAWKIKLAGLADYTLKLGGNFDLTDAEQALLQASIITTPGATVTWRVYPGGIAGTHYYSGTALVKTEGVKIDVKAEETVTFDLEGSGPISYT